MNNVGRNSGANTGIPSGGSEILKRDQYTKKGEKAIFYLNYLFKIRSDFNFILILY